MNTKHIIAASVFAALTAFPSQANIIFNFDYSSNTANEGFLDAVEGQARRDAMDTAGNLFSNLFGSYFSDSATLDIAVTSSDDPNSSTLASAGSNLVSTCSNPGPGGCVITEVVKTKLQTGVDANGAGLDGSVDVNWGWNWNVDPNRDAVYANQEFDFFAAIFHELTHALGFSSIISLDGYGFFNDEWTSFDTFLQDKNGNKVIDNNFFLDHNTWDNIKEGGSGNGIFFGGANAVAANGGQLVGIYSPTTWQSGSSGSHIDGVGQFSSDMMKYDRDYGPETRTYSDVDVGILTDLGYTRNVVASVPEPSTLGLGLFGMLCALFIRRKNS